MEVRAAILEDRRELEFAEWDLRAIFPPNFNSIFLANSFQQCSDKLRICSLLFKHRNRAFLKIVSSIRRGFLLQIINQEGQLFVSNLCNFLAGLIINQPYRSCRLAIRWRWHTKIFEQRTRPANAENLL